MLLHLVLVVRTLSQLLLQHVDDLVLVLLVDALQVLLVVYDILLIDDPAVDLQRILHLAEASLEDLVEVGPGDGPGEVDDLFPGEGNALLSAGPVLLQQEDDRFEDAPVEDGDGLARDKDLLALLHLGRVVFAGEEVLLVDEGLVRNQGIVLIVGNLEVPQELQVLQGRKSLVLVQLHHDVVD